MENTFLTNERSAKLHEVEAYIEYTFKDISNLDKALTHSSYRNHPDYVTAYRNINECLEFLGDSVLDFVISEYLYNLYSDWDEGRLSKFRSKVVCEQSLVIAARKIFLWRYILVGKGECQDENMNPSIMADAVEAIIAGVYLDGGMDAARDCIMRLLEPNIKDIISKKILRDSKTELQEMVQRMHAGPVTYSVVNKVGPQHDAVFTVKAVFEGVTIGTGSGKSKKEAEQNAASEGIEYVEKILQRRTKS